jgi:inorganic pyrophosphatase
MSTADYPLQDLLAKLFKAHPWHGVLPGPDAPAIVNAYVEIVPTDAVKYELDKPSGHLRVDRPQRFSSMCPTPYGFIPQTFCGSAVAALCETRTGRKSIRGDGDPLDICVLTERPAAHGDFIARAVPIGGLRMIDGDEQTTRSSPCSSRTSAMATSRHRRRAAGPDRPAEALLPEL